MLVNLFMSYPKSLQYHIQYQSQDSALKSENSIIYTYRYLNSHIFLCMRNWGQCQDTASVSVRCKWDGPASLCVHLNQFEPTHTGHVSRVQRCCVTEVSQMQHCHRGLAQGPLLPVCRALNLRAQYCIEKKCSVCGQMRT